MTSGTRQATLFFCFLGIGSIIMSPFVFLLLFSGSDKASKYTTMTVLKCLSRTCFYQSGKDKSYHNLNHNNNKSLTYSNKFADTN